MKIVKIVDMEGKDWLGCGLLEAVPGKVSGAVVFKDTRLPVEAVVGNVDAFMELENMSESEAVEATSECYPSTPGGAESIRAVLAFREAHQHLLQP